MSGIAPTRDSPSPPFWRKTSTTSTTPVAVAVPVGAHIVKVWVDVLSYVSFGTTASAPAVAGVDAVQTIKTLGTPTGGTFKLSFRGQQTATIAYNDSSANIDTAIEALSTVGANGVVSAGGALPTAVTVTWSGSVFTATPVPLLVVSDNSLTGGTDAKVQVVMTTAGSAPYGYVEAGTQELIPVNKDDHCFVYIATVASTGNYRLSCYR